MFLLEWVEVTAVCSWAASALSEVLPSVTCSLIIIPTSFFFFSFECSLSVLDTTDHTRSLLQPTDVSQGVRMLNDDCCCSQIKSADFTGTQRLPLVQCLATCPLSVDISWMKQWFSSSHPPIPPNEHQLDVKHKPRRTMELCPGPRWCSSLVMRRVPPWHHVSTNSCMSQFSFVHKDKSPDILPQIWRTTGMLQQENSSFKNWHLMKLQNVFWSS